MWLKETQTWVCAFNMKNTIVCTKIHLKQPFRGGGQSREGGREKENYRGKERVGGWKERLEERERVKRSV